MLNRHERIVKVLQIARRLLTPRDDGDVLGSPIIYSALADAVNTAVLVVNADQSDDLLRSEAFRVLLTQAESDEDCKRALTSLKNTQLHNAVLAIVDKAIAKVLSNA